MKDSILPTITALSARRSALGFNQEAVASRAGLTQTYISKIEQGKVDPRLSTLQEVARSLRLELMLVPTELVPAVEAITGRGQNPEERPLFQIEPD